jgi:tRNA pseudouridine55 synthase
MPRKGNAIDGVLLLDKPRGITSNAALQRAKRALNAAKAGHTGTLDPMASGLLPLCFGEGTKFSGLLLDADKTYRAEITLGVSTATGDAEGAIIGTRSTGELAAAVVRDVLFGLVGSLEQVPPMYSALKHAGRPMYEYAREGRVIERASRTVEILALEVLRIDPPVAEIRVRVSKGTYIRSLAEEVGRRLHCGGHLSALRRETVGRFSIGDSVTLEAFEGMPVDSRLGLLLPPDALLEGVPRVDLNEREGVAVRQGRSVRIQGAVAGLVRLYDHCGAFMGVGQAGEDASIAPQRLLQTT